MKTFNRGFVFTILAFGLVAHSAQIAHAASSEDGFDSKDVHFDFPVTIKSTEWDLYCENSSYQSQADALMKKQLKGGLPAGYLGATSPYCFGLKFHREIRQISEGKASCEKGKRKGHAHPCNCIKAVNENGDPRLATYLGLFNRPRDLDAKNEDLGMEHGKSCDLQLSAKGVPQFDKETGALLSEDPVYGRTEYCARKQLNQAFKAFDQACHSGKKSPPSARSLRPWVKALEASSEKLYQRFEVRGMVSSMFKGSGPTKAPGEAPDLAGSVPNQNTTEKVVEKVVKEERGTRGGEGTAAEGRKLEVPAMPAYEYRPSKVEEERVRVPYGE